MISRSSGASRMSDKSVGSSEPISFHRSLSDVVSLLVSCKRLVVVELPHIKLFSDPNNSALFLIFIVVVELPHIKLFSDPNNSALF